MKKQIILVALLALLALTNYAQTDPTTYLNWTRERLEVGDCEGAQKWYNVYTRTTGSRNMSIETLIQNCSNNTHEIGDQLCVGNNTYTVAYVRDGGKHGLAVLNKGWGRLSEDESTYITQKGIPNFDELKLIYQNKDVLGLYGVYWSCTEDVASSRYIDNGHQNTTYSNGLGTITTSESIKCYVRYYYRLDFSTGKVDSDRYDANHAVVLLVHRF